MALSFVIPFDASLEGEAKAEVVVFIIKAVVVAMRNSAGLIDKEPCTATVDIL